MDRDSKLRRSGIAWAACALGGFSASAHAGTTYTVEAGAGHSDNITRVDAGQIDETIGKLGLDLAMEVERSRMTANVNVNADYYEYTEDTFESEVVGAGDAQLNFTLVPDRLNWRFEDYFGQQNNDPFAPITPDTRESVNYFSTGPDLLLRLGPVGMRVYGMYSLATYEVSPVDNERVSGGFSIGRPGASGRGLSFNAAHESVAYSEQDGSDFERLSTYLAYGISGSRTDIRLEGGYTWLHPEVGEESDAPRFLLQVDRELTRYSRLSLSAGTQLTDSSAALSSSIDGPGGGGGAASVTATADPFENRNASLTWGFARHRTSLNIGVAWDSDEYETDSELDSTTTSIDVSVDRRLGARIGAGLSASFTDEDFETADFSSKAEEYAAWLTWDIGRSLGLRLTFERSDRNTSTGAGEYVDNRGFLTIYYNGSRGTTSAAPGGGAAP